MSQITNPKKVQSKSRSHEVSHIEGQTYKVISGTSRKEYTVTLQDQGGRCTCEWASYRKANDKRSGCSHVVSVFNHLAEEANSRAMAWGSAEDAKRQHRATLAIGDGVTLTFRKAGK